MALRSTVPPPPPPPEGPVLLSNSGQTTAGSSDVDQVDWIAQQFTTGPNPTGYTLSSLSLKSSTAQTTVPVTVTLRADDNGEPGSTQLATFDNPSYWYAGDNHFNISSPEGLKPNTTYWVRVAATDTIDVDYTSSATVDSGGEAGYSIGYSCDSDACNGTATERYQMVLRGRVLPLPDVLVANTGQTTAGSSDVNQVNWTAQQFTTGPNPAGYDLSFVTLEGASAQATVPLTLTLRDDDDGSPSSTVLATFDNPADWIAGDNLFSLSTAFELEPDTAYWLYMDPSASIDVSYTRRTTVDRSSQAGWSIGYSCDSNGCDGTYANRHQMVLRGVVATIRLHADNTSPTAIWSNDGQILWVAQFNSTRVYAYDLSDGSAVPDADWRSFYAQTKTQGMWSDGEFVWRSEVAGGSQSGLFMFYYQYLQDENVNRYVLFDLPEGIGKHVRGIWGDGVHLYVADDNNDKIHVLNLPRRVGSSLDIVREFDLDSDNSDPRDIWSNGNHLWVMDRVDRKIYAYSLATGARYRRGDITLDPNMHNPTGIWSDGTTMYAVENGSGNDIRDSRIHTFPLPPSSPKSPPSPAPADEDGADSDGLRTATLSPAQFGLTSGHTSATAAHSPDGDFMWVLHFQNRFVRAYNLSDGTPETSKNWHTLSSRSYTHLFWANTYPTGIWSDDDFIYITDNNPVEGGVIAGIWVYSADDMKFHAFISNPADPNDRSVYPIFEEFNGVWGNDDYLYISDKDQDRIHVFDRNDFLALTDLGFDLDAENQQPRDLWSDGRALYVMDAEDKKAYAYRLDGGVRLPDQDLEAPGDWDRVLGIWSDGARAWFVENPLGSGTQQMVRGLDFPWTPGDVEVFHVTGVDDGEVSLFWSGGPTNGSDVLGWVIRRQENGGEWDPWEPVSEHHIRGSQNYTATGLTNGNVYGFQVGLRATSWELGREYAPLPVLPSRKVVYASPSAESDCGASADDACVLDPLPDRGTGSRSATGVIEHAGQTGGSITIAGERHDYVFDQDIDWYRLTVKRGEYYRFSVAREQSEGGGLADPFIVGIYVDGHLYIAGTANDDTTKYLADADGDIYIAVSGAWGKGHGGSYRLDYRRGRLVTAIGDETEVVLHWDRESQFHSYRYKEDGGSFGAWTPLENFRDGVAVYDHTVEGLSSNKDYTFEIRTGGADNNPVTVTTRTRDDCAQTNSTACEAEVGGEVTGVLKASGSINSKTGAVSNVTEDVDRWKLTTVPGTIYRVFVRGSETPYGKLKNPTVTVYNSAGNKLDKPSFDSRSNPYDGLWSVRPDLRRDPEKSNRTAYIEFEALGSGGTSTHYIEVEDQTGATPIITTTHETGRGRRAGFRSRLPPGLPGQQLHPGGPCHAGSGHRSGPGGGGRAADSDLERAGRQRLADHRGPVPAGRLRQLGGHTRELRRRSQREQLRRARPGSRPAVRIRDNGPEHELRGGLPALHPVVHARLQQQRGQDLQFWRHQIPQELCRSVAAAQRAAAFGQRLGQRPDRPVLDDHETGLDELRAPVVDGRRRDVASGRPGPCRYEYHLQPHRAVAGEHLPVPGAGRQRRRAGRLVRAGRGDHGSGPEDRAGRAGQPGRRRRGPQPGRPVLGCKQPGGDGLRGAVLHGRDDLEGGEPGPRGHGHLLHPQRPQGRDHLPLPGAGRERRRAGRMVRRGDRHHVGDRELKVGPPAARSARGGHQRGHRADLGRASGRRRRGYGLPGGALGRLRGEPLPGDRGDHGRGHDPHRRKRRGRGVLLLPGQGHPRDRAERPVQLRGRYGRGGHGGAGGGSQQSGHGPADHQRNRPGGRNADGGHVGHLG